MAGGAHDGPLAGAVAGCGRGVATAEAVAGEIGDGVAEAAHVLLDDECDALGGEGPEEHSHPAV